MQTVTYDAIEHALTELQIPCEASEWHGVASAMLCVDFTVSLDSCLQHICGQQSDFDAVADNGLLSDLAALFDDTKSRLLDAELRYQLFLPPDGSVALSERVEALVQWCRGYIFGLYGTPGWQQRKQSDEMDEMLHDINSISMADAKNALDEADEQSYHELVEYLKVLVLSVAEELQPLAKPSELLQ